jgi:hypothetical protein
MSGYTPFTARCRRLRSMHSLTPPAPRCEARLPPPPAPSPPPSCARCAQCSVGGAFRCSERRALYIITRDEASVAWEMERGTDACERTHSCRVASGRAPLLFEPPWRWPLRACPAGGQQRVRRGGLVESGPRPARLLTARAVRPRTRLSLAHVDHGVELHLMSVLRSLTRHLGRCAPRPPVLAPQ